MHLSYLLLINLITCFLVVSVIVKSAQTLSLTTLITEYSIQQQDIIGDKDIYRYSESDTSIVQVRILCLVLL